MCRVLNMSVSWIFQDCQYARILSFQGFTEFTYFRKYDRVLNMQQDAIMEDISLFQDSKHVRFLQMQALHKVLNMLEYGWIIPE